MVPLEPYLGKKYKLKTSENFDDYLKVIKVGYFLRKTAATVSPTVCLTRNQDGSYTLSMTSTFKSTSVTFNLGEEFVEPRLDGVKVKSTMVVEGDDLIQTQVEDDGTISTHVRKFTPTTLTVITTAEGWEGKCIRVYELVGL